MPCALRPVSFFYYIPAPCALRPAPCALRPAPCALRLFSFIISSARGQLDRQPRAVVLVKVELVELVQILPAHLRLCP